MIIHNEGQTASFGPSLILAATFLSLIVVAVKSASCFKRKHEDDVPSTVDSFTISRWSCLCNWWGKSDPLRWTDDDNKFTTDSVKSMNIKKEPKKVRDGKSYFRKESTASDLLPKNSSSSHRNRCCLKRTEGSWKTIDLL